MTGLKDKFNIIKADKNYGDVHGLIYTINTAFTLYPNINDIIIIEDDLIFNENWLEITKLILARVPKPYGVFSVYNWMYDTKFNTPLFENKFRVTGQMYCISRDAYNKMKEANIFTYDLNLMQISQYLRGFFTSNLAGDAFLIKFLEKHNLKCYTSCNSYIQHLGIQSLCRPNQEVPIRCSKNFIHPLAWNEWF